jgi:Zn-dependent M16 (insulinase) family peptidase
LENILILEEHNKFLVNLSKTHPMAAPSSRVAKMVQNFFKVCSVQSNNRLKVSLYRSALSGMRVAFVDQPSPVVNGWFSFATKATSDDGLPHTLEHLVFMGSHRYPYKGFLDSIANRCFASGTNGYTDEDHTAYSITTVGSEGFLKTLPVYLDHLLYPMLTPEQYTTEVHHINGEGRNGGVVYAEMQDHENDMDTRIDFTRRRLAFPEGNPFRANTGGALPALRDLCSLERVIDFHKQHYNHTNMMITVVGPIDENKVIDVLSNLETFGYQRPLSTKRPFDDVVLPERYTPKLEHVQCPVEDESNGTVSITWQGPLHADSDSSALQILLSYFCDGPDSPLQQRFVQIKDPICSDISRESRERSRVELAFRFGGVKRKFLKNEELFSNIPLSVLRESKIDMDRMKAMIEQQIHQMDVMLEGNPTHYYHGIFSVYALYAPGVNADSDNVPYLEKRLNEVTNLKSLLQRDASYWEGLVSKYFTKDQIIVIGNPNAKLVDELAEKEEERVKAQVERLGTEGLKKCGEALQKAVAKNEASAPTEDILRNFIVNDIDVKLIEVGREQKSSNSSNPYPTICHKVDSNFLHATVLFDLHGISAEHRSAIQLYMELLTESDVKIDGEIVSYEKAATMLKKDFIAHKIDLGVKKDFEEFLAFHYIVLPEKYSNIAKWTEIFLKNVIFENPRIAVVAKRLAGNASELKQDGDAIAQALMTKMIAVENSNKSFNCLLSSAKFHKEIADYASYGKSDKMVDIMNELAQKIAACPANIHLIGNIDSLESATSNGWKSLSKVENTTKFLTGTSEYSIDLSKNKGNTYCIPHGSSESAFLIQRSESKFDFLDPRIVYAKLLSQYFCQCEGPLFTHIRGKGLAYGVYIYVTGNTGLGFYLYRAADMIKAYDESKRVVLETITSRTVDTDQFEAAKRSLISDLVQSVSHVKKAGKFSIIEQLRGIATSESIVKYQVDQIWQATPEKMFDAVSQTFVDLFDDQKCIRSVVPYKTDLKKTQQFFKNTKTMKIDNLYFENLITK